MAQEYAPLPPPTDTTEGPFTLKEVHALKKKMPNTVPGPDGIQYAFWKSLASMADDQKLPSLWDMFRDLTNNLQLRGTN